MLPLGSSEIGGGIVRLRFTLRGKSLLAGTPLTAAEINAMPISNRRALISSGKIAVYPPAPRSAPIGERHIVHNGGGRYDVIAGQKLNTGPLTKDDAEELATRPN